MGRLTVCRNPRPLAFAAILAAAPVPKDLAELVARPSFDSIRSVAFETILSDSQRQEYELLDDIDREGFRAHYWNVRDPTPTTDENEFLEDHLRRILFAVEECCPVDSLLWDDRGTIALRFGVPPVRSKDLGDVIGDFSIHHPTEVWAYPDHGITVSFLEPSLNGWYVLGEDVPVIRRAPPVPAPPIEQRRRPPPPPSPRNIDAEMEATRAHDEQQAGQRAVARVPVAYVYTPPADPIPLVYEVVTARGQGRETDVAVNYQFPMSGLTFHGDEPGLLASPVKRIRIMTLEHETLTAHARTLTVACETREAAVGDFLVTDEWRIDMPPGEYLIAVSVEDTTTQRTGTGLSRVLVPSYVGRRLRMSDVLVATDVSEGDRFRRMNAAVIPHPVRAFRRGTDLVLYFELYGLAEDRPRHASFTIETDITGREAKKHEGWFQRLFRRKRAGTTSRVAATGDAPDTAYWFRLSTANLPPDNYDVTIRVRDTTADVEVEESATFTVLPN